jgi:putative flavoprotein involved in K+ transport
MRRLTVGDLAQYGLPEPADGLYERVLRDDSIPLVDMGFLDAVKSGQVAIVAAVTGFDREAVRLADGTTMTPDAVIAATGYRHGLAPLVGHLGVLGEDGRPTVRGPQTHSAAPNLWFSGFTNPVSGMFRELGIDAKRIARAVAKARATTTPGAVPGKESTPR